MTSATVRKDDAAERSVDTQPKATPHSHLDPMPWISQQQRMGETYVAAGQKFLEGFQEVTNRSLLLQSALLQQMLANMLSLAQLGASDASGDDGVRAVTSSMESTAASIRDVMAAACKCHVDTLAAFRSRGIEDGQVGSAACGRPEAPRSAA